MSHLTCTNCGQKSPDDAKRCKHCGRAFGQAPERPEDSRSSGSLLSVALFLAAGAAIFLAVHLFWPKFSGAPSAAPSESTTVATPTPPTKRDSTPVPAPTKPQAAPAESTRAAAPATVAAPSPSPSRPPRDSLPAAKDTAKPVTPTPAPQPVSIDPTRQRYAKVWANLRADRSTSGAILQVLHPGEVVAVDSLEQGWFRVTTDQQTVGYVDQSFLDTLPPGNP